MTGRPARLCASILPRPRPKCAHVAVFMVCSVAGSCLESWHAQKIFTSSTWRAWLTVWAGLHADWAGAAAEQRQRALPQHSQRRQRPLLLCRRPCQHGASHPAPPHSLARCWCGPRRQSPMP